MISLLLAMDKNNVIGLNKDLPWRLPKDLRFFKEKTTGQTVIMGRKTFESMGGALPNRENVIITKKQSGFPENVKVINDLKTIKEWSKSNPDKEYFVIGGGNIFEQILDYADRMYITYIDEAFDGDTYFPGFPAEQWDLTSKVKGEKNDTNPYDYYFLQYDRK
ncbi:dihydrofolate reductase [Virgibacillus profundi]|uniref:Dihydrofolate reductase n=1 Tax=Virgibacillus profundi TaxID=2024555 RepID=A0A2A2IBR8_9BACI|nr:dihydrofolate reductase [Virgibacillus profundi]PAV29451.1 dihydrofolate reductase [Virgibacillus profundi]PXY53620.1 dihydrofolate reductase [Virgibacillus profundi]